MDCDASTLDQQVSGHQTGPLMELATSRNSCCSAAVPSRMSINVYFYDLTITDNEFMFLRVLVSGSRRSECRHVHWQSHQAISVNWLLRVPNVQIPSLLVTVSYGPFKLAWWLYSVCNTDTDAPPSEHLSALSMSSSIGQPSTRPSHFRSLSNSSPELPPSTSCYVYPTVIFCHIVLPTDLTPPLP